MNEGENPQSLEGLLDMLSQMQCRLDELEKSVRELRQSVEPERGEPAIEPADSAPTPPGGDGPSAAEPPGLPIPGPFEESPAREQWIAAIHEAVKGTFPAEASEPPAEAPEPAAGLSRRGRGGWALVAVSAVVLVGSAFFLRHAYEMGWISQTARVAAFAALSVLLLGGSWVYHRAGMKR